MPARVAAKRPAPLSGTGHIHQGIDDQEPVLAQPLASRRRSGRT